MQIYWYRNDTKRHGKHVRRVMNPQTRKTVFTVVMLFLLHVVYVLWRTSVWNKGEHKPPRVKVGNNSNTQVLHMIEGHIGNTLGNVHAEKGISSATLISTRISPRKNEKTRDKETSMATYDFVAVCAATRSRSGWTALDASDPVRILLPSLARTTTPGDNVRVFLGANIDDVFWGGGRAQELTRHARTAWSLDVALRQYAHAPNHIPFNALMRDAFDAGAEFLVRVNDDTEFVTPGWVRLGVDALAAFEPPNVGVVGPVCREGNTHILTHDMVHRKHLTIFDTYYPSEFSNWYVDDWISRVYGAARTRRHEGWVVKHRLTPMRYRPEERERAQLEVLVGTGVQRVAQKLAKTQDSVVKYAIFTACDSSVCEMYQRNINTLRCYAKRHADYELAIFSEKDTHVQGGCTAKLMKFRRHCMLANFLESRQDIAAVLFLDSDSAVLDFNKRFEQFAVKDLNFEIRFHNGEIACSPTIAKNTAYTRQFFKEWGAMHNFPLNEDNGALHQLILTRLENKDECFKQSKNYDEFRRCFVRVVNERNCDDDFWNNYATVAFPLKTFSYDGWLTKYRYSDRTFIHHAMKNPPIAGNNEGRLMPDVLQHNCNLIKSNDDYYISVQEQEKILQTQLIAAERHNWVKGGMTMDSCLNKHIHSDVRVRELTQPAHTPQLIDKSTLKYNNKTPEEITRLHHDTAADLTLRIIVLTMNRVWSLRRLFKSLQHAEYDGNVAHLDIWIDVQENLVPNSKALEVCKELVWNAGVKTIHVHSEPHGLRGQWFKTYSMSVAENEKKRRSEVVVLFEDDVEVSPLYWTWLKTVHKKYAQTSEIAGFSLGRLNLCSGFCPPLNGGPAVENSVFLHPIVGTTGFSPTVKHWDAFTQWALEFEKHEHLVKPYVDGIVQTSWYKSFERSQRCPGRQCFWEMLHIYYGTTHSDKYTMYAKWSDGCGLGINHQEKGLHYEQALGKDTCIMNDIAKIQSLQLEWNPPVVDVHGVLTASPQSPDAPNYIFRARAIFESCVRRNADIQKQFIIVMMVNRAFTPFVRSWLCNTAHMHDVHARLLLIFTDDSLHEIPTTFNITKVYVHGEALATADSDYDTYGYWKLVQKRVHIIAKIVEQGIPLLLCEPDAVWLQNPLADSNLRSDVDFVGYSDAGIVPGFGFLLVKSSRACTLIMTKLCSLFDGFMQIGLGKKDVDKFTPKIREQDLLQQILKSNEANATFRMLSAHKYVNGQWYSDVDLRARVQKANGAVVINNNYIIGNGKKIDRAKAWNHWFVHENAQNICKNNNTLSAQSRKLQSMEKMSLHNHKIFGHVHIAKTSGTTLNGNLSMLFERVCGHKGYSYDSFQANQRRSKEYKDSFGIMHQGYNRLRVHSDIMEEIGYEDCDWISHEIEWSFWKKFITWRFPLQLHVPCRDPVDHLMSQCNHARIKFNCSGNLHAEIQKCIFATIRFSNELLSMGNNIEVKCFDWKAGTDGRYVNFMKTRLQEKKMQTGYNFIPTNQKRAFTTECVWNNKKVKKNIAEYLINNYDYYAFCNKCTHTKDDLFYKH